MERMTDNKIILVTQKTRLEQMVVRYNTIGQAKFFIEHSGGTFGDYEREHETYTAAAAAAEEILARFGRVLRVDRDLVPTMVFGPADTVVALENEIMGKPEDREDAVRMLRAQSKEPQQVMTGVSLVAKTRFSACGCCCQKDGCAKTDACIEQDVLVRTFAEKTLVYFHPLDEAQEARIQAYCDTEEPYDKAGAYGIQQHGDVLVERFEGDYDNIVGFPVERIRQEIEEYFGLKF